MLVEGVLVHCASNADFCAQSGLFTLSKTQYLGRHCSPSPSDWLNGELNNLSLGRKRKGGTSWPRESEKGSQVVKEGVAMGRGWGRR